MGRIIAKTLNVDGESVFTKFQEIGDGAYAWIRDNYEGEMSGYMIARIIFMIFVAEPEVKEIVLPIAPDFPKVAREKTFEKVAVEVLKLLSI